MSQWKTFNGKMRGFPPPSVACISMGHYKVALYNKDLALLHAAKITLCARMGVPLNRWGF